MRTHNCLLPKVHFLATFGLAAFGLALIVGQIPATFAQEDGDVVPASNQSGGFFSQSLGTALLPRCDSTTKRAATARKTTCSRLAV